MSDYKKLEKRMEDYIALVDEHIITSSTDLHGNITYVSKAFCRISKYSEAELLGQNHRIVRHKDMPKELYDDMWEHLANDRAWSGEIKNKAKDGSSYWVKADISPIWNEDGDKIGYTAIRQDITDKKTLEEFATRDYLTGLYNRLKLDKIINYEITQSHRYETPLSIIILDIDYFKNVNDTCGHQAGDEVLKEVAQICQSTCRHSDSIGRWGGEEFLIVLPKTDLHGALIEAERLRDAIDHYTFSIVSHKTASFGVSQLIELDSLGSFIERADNALYRAKENGRNRVVG
jgi:diguanylate cyclase (GGDEF)-like protein/PAS domain S-box-containing protein